MMYYFRLRRFLRRCMQALFAACLCATVADARSYPCRVVRVVDGDTIVVIVSLGLGVELGPETARLAGIDTPELKAKDPDERRRAEAARDALRAFAPGGSIGMCEISDADPRDKFGRLLSAVTMPGKGDAATHLLGLGLARTYDGGPR